MCLDPMSGLRAPRPSIWRIYLSSGGIESHTPVLTELRRGHGEPDWLGVGVEEQQEMVVGDRAPDGVDFGNGVAVEEHHYSACESRIPVSLIHFRRVGLEPQDVAELAAPAVFGITGKEPPTPQYGMSLA